MTDAAIEIRVSGENAQEVLDRIAAALPPDAAIMAAEPAQIPDLGARVQGAVAAMGDLGSAWSEWLAASAAAGGVSVALAILLAALVVAAAWALDVGLVRAMRGRLEGDADAGATARALRWLAGRIGRLAFFAAAAQGIGALVFAPGTAQAAMLVVLLGGALRVRVLAAAIDLLAAPEAPERRPTALKDAEAALIARAAVPMIAVQGAADMIASVLDKVLEAGASATILLIAARLIAAAAAAHFFCKVRAPVARLFRLAFAPEGESALGRWFDRWHWVYGGLLLLNVAVAASGRLMLGYAELGDAGASAGYSFQIFVFGPVLLAWIGAWKRASLAAGEEAGVPASGGLRAGLFALLEGAAVILCALLLFYAWNIDPFATDAAGAARIVPKLVAAALTLVVGFAIWRTATAFLDAFAPASAAEGDGPPEGEGGRAGDRFETVYPILRMAAQITLGVLTAMVALAALGVDIGPLLAGAGVLGLALGFGAQTLVKDVISGMFYLYEDAFRVGEYIETGQGKGAVEKILLRSVRLRHPRGAVYTIPFGSLGTIQNHSRDWTTVKFSFLVGQDEDLEKLRKLVKKTGQKLLADPELEGQFIEPLKSQGAVAMQGPNYEIGVKFTCRPGEQFLIRRKAYAAIQKALREAGIQVATPKVVVDAAPGQGAAPAAGPAAGPVAGPAPEAGAAADAAPVAADAGSAAPRGGDAAEGPSAPGGAPEGPRVSPV